MEIDHDGLEVLSRTECLRLLRTAVVGRLALTTGALPTVLPVNFTMHGDDVVFQEVTQLGVTAAGAGAVRNTRLLGEYTAVNSMTGMVDLRLQPDGSLAGAFIFANGSSASIAMYYQSP